MAPHRDVVISLGLALVAASTAPMLLLDKDLRVVSASASFCKSFQIDEASTAGCLLAELGAGEWNVPQLSSLLRATAGGYAEVEGYEMDLARENRDTRRLVVNAKKLNYDASAEVRLVLSVADITEARIAEKIKDDLVRDKGILLQELHHRVANSLQIVASVLMQSARKVQSEETRAHLHDAHQRVMSIASMQKQLAASKSGDVELRPYLISLCESIGASMIRDHNQLTLEVTSDDGITTADTSVSLGLIVTELVINALKHAFPDNRQGTIKVDYHTQWPNWKLSVNDDGIGMPENPQDAKPGLGTGIVEALAKQLGAIVTVRPANPGTFVSVAHRHIAIVSDASKKPAQAV